MKKSKKIVYVLCDNIRSAHNVGAIFRTADASGVSKMILGGITPSPVDRFGRIKKEIAKTALGAEKTVYWEKADNLVKSVSQLKKDGFFIVALEQKKSSVNFRKLKPFFPMALILGNEVDGVSNPILRLADNIIEIPMVGKKESLNVTVAFGVAIFEIMKNRL